MAQTIKVLLAEGDLDSRIGLKKLLFQVPPEIKPILMDKEIEIVGEAESLKEAETLTARLSPTIILISANLKDTSGIDAACRIAQTFPASGVIIISEHLLTHDELKKAMFCGVRSFLVQPLDPQEVHKVIVEIFELNSQRAREISVPPPQIIKSKLIAMFSAKGGVGRTLLSTNLAVVMAERLHLKGKKIALIDLDLQFGDIAIMLNLIPTKTITGLAKEINELGEIDEELFESYLIKYRDKLAVLPAPLKPEEADLIKAEHIEKILNMVRHKYHYTIIDCSTTLSEPILVALSSADVIILMLTLDIPTIKNAKLSLELMGKLGYGHKVKVVVNRANTKMGISIQQVKEALASPLMELVPSNGCVAIPSVNEGVPFIIKYPKSNISKSIGNLADKLIESVDKSKPRKWWR